MVNELNKPQDNSALSELLAASNRQLQEMQEEHRQLQEELSRLSVQRQQLRQATREHHSQVTSTTISSSGSVLGSESSSFVAEGAAEAQAAAADVEEEEDKEETASYLQEKLAEIANLKAQFKRVQNMTDSTKQIEQHLSSLESQSSTATVMKSRQTKIMESVQSSSSSTSTSRSALSSSATASETETESATSAASETSGTPDNAELLNAMINMVTDFTSDLRGQEETIRAERLRIKTLKEEIIQRKQSK